MVIILFWIHQAYLPLHFSQAIVYWLVYSCFHGYQPVDVYEVMVYALLLTAAIVVTSLMYHKNYCMGNDGMKNYILNLIRLSSAAIGVVYEKLKECQKHYAKGQPLLHFI